MAEFCRPCAFEPSEGLGEAWVAKAPPGTQQLILCEGCGWVRIDDQGNPPGTPKIELLLKDLEVQP